jgi:hypothetical protein
MIERTKENEMSTTEYHTGKIREIAIDFDGFENKVNAICDARDTTPEEMGFNEFPDEYIYEEESGFQYTFINGKLYEFVSHAEDRDYCDIYNASRAEDGEIEFTLQYYNGGCCFSEALEAALKKLNK